MTTVVASARGAAIQTLKEHLTELTLAVDRQALGLLPRSGARVIDARREGERVVLTCQTSLGDIYETTRDAFLPMGDDGSSYVYQVKVLEQLALEHAGVREALERAEASIRLLDTPPLV